jgi:hypothetical protein
MAECFMSNFKEKLIREPLPECREADRDFYPSPEQLKYKVIVKHKKLKAGSQEVLLNSSKRV